jgi:hypothetical protein
MRLSELVRVKPGLDLAVQSVDLPFKKIEVAECVPQEKAMMFIEPIPA